MPPSLRKDRKLTDKGKAFATESGNMPPRVDNSGGVDGDRGSTGQSRPPPEEEDRNQAFESDPDRTVNPENGDLEVRDETPPEPLRRRAGGQRNNPAPSITVGSLDRDTMTALTHLVSQMHKQSKDISRGSTVPKWDRGRDPFLIFEQEVTMWLESHDLKHLLTDAPDDLDDTEMRQHRQAKLVVISQLSREDKTITYNYSYLHEVWAYLKAKYHPSDKADIEALWHRWENLKRGNRSVKEYHAEIISIYERLVALEEAPEERNVRRKMYNCGPEYDVLRYDLEDKELPFRAIMGKFVAHEQRLKMRAAANRQSDGDGSGGGGRRPRPPRGGTPAVDPGDSFPAVLAVAGASDLPKGKPDDVCAWCKKKGHFKRDCPALSPELRKHLQEEAVKRRAEGTRRPRRQS